MKKYQATDIDWDTDGEAGDLPTTATFELDDDQDPEMDGADALSDKYGWCVTSFSHEEII